MASVTLGSSTSLPCRGETILTSARACPANSPAGSGRAPARYVAQQPWSIIVLKETIDRNQLVRVSGCRNRHQLAGLFRAVEQSFGRHRDPIVVSTAQANDPHNFRAGRQVDEAGCSVRLGDRQQPVVERKRTGFSVESPQQSPAALVEAIDAVFIPDENDSAVGAAHRNQERVADRKRTDERAAGIPNAAIAPASSAGDRPPGPAVMISRGQAM